LCFARPRHDGVEFGGKIGKVEMTVRVDEHHNAPARRDVDANMRALLSTVCRGSR
jgi:hypothetical protein